MDWISPGGRRYRAPYGANNNKAFLGMCVYISLFWVGPIVSAEIVSVGQGQRTDVLQLHPPQRSLGDQQDRGDIQAESANNAHQGKF